MALSGLLWCVGALLAISVAALAVAPLRAATVLVYGTALCVCATALGVAATCLLAGNSCLGVLTLPVGLPWLGTHFRLDALAAFFLVVVNLGGAAASLYGLGYGHHEPAPHRVL